MADDAEHDATKNTPALEQAVAALEQATANMDQVTAALERATVAMNKPAPRYFDPGGRMV
jgi:exonuclease VII small subunit